MKKNVVRLFLILAVIVMATIPALAEDCPFSLRLSGQVTPYLSGDAGDGANAPEYNDAFDIGLGLNIEGAYQIKENFSLLIGIGYEKYSGRDYKGISFDDHKIMPVYLGGKYNFKVKESKWIPYLKADIGMARMASVNITYLGTETKYWGDSWEPMFDFGAGLEYRKNSFGFFLELKARYINSPSSSMNPYSDADDAWSMPLTIGVSVYF